ncbi:MAG TPA: hypothetical protein VIS76_17755 [Pseudomonadales bacterium]
MLPQRGAAVTGATRRSLVALAPGLVVLVGALAVSMVLGGPIAAVITGFVAVFAVLINAGIVVPLVIGTSIRAAWALLLLGTGAYIGSVLLVLVLWTYFGPSQIM